MNDVCIVCKPWLISLYLIQLHDICSAAPNQYNAMRGLAAESEYKAYFASTLHGAFGSTTERRNPMINRDAVSLPGPGAYQVVDNKERCPPGNRGVVRASANFVSQSARILKTPKASVVSVTYVF